MSVIELIASLTAQDIRLWLEDGQLRFSAPKDGMSEETRNQLKQYKPAIIEFLAKNQKTELIPIKKVDHQALQPLSYSQERIWFLCQLEPENSAFNLHSVFDIKGKLDQSILQKTWNEIIARHSILRTAYIQTETGTYQKILDKKTIELNHKIIQTDNLSSLQLQKIADTEAEKPFDLESGDVTHNCLLEITDEHFMLFCTIHHIATDGWSMSIMAKEIATLYEAFSTNKTQSIDALRIQYEDFAVWQRQQTQEAHIQHQLNYWKKELDNIPPLILPGDHPRPVITHSKGSSISFKFNKHITADLHHLAKENGVTLYMILLSLFSTLLYRYSQQETFCIGTPIAGRTNSQLEPLMGCFVNMLAIKSQHESDENFIQLLEKTRLTTQAAFAHQDIPFEQVVKEVVTDRNLSLTPIFQVMFSLQNMPFDQTTSVEGIEIQAINPEKHAALYDLSLTANEWQGELLAEFEYKTEVFEAESIHRMSENFSRLVRAVLQEPEKAICDIDFISDQDKAKQLSEWNQTTYKRNQLQGIHHYIEKQAKISPAAIAIKYGDAELNYQSLDKQSNQLAHYLIQQGVAKRSVVGICLDRSLELPIALLAILKAGASYLPLDLSYPQERLDFIAKDTGIKHVVSSGDLNEWKTPESIQRINIDTDISKWRSCSSVSPKIELPGTALFNIIYTSGSTGQPKGVMVSHHAMINRLLWMQETFPLISKDRVLQKTPYSFDVSVWEIFWPLMFGASLVIAKPQGQKNTGYLRDLIQQEQISTMHFVPSMLSAFLQTEDIDHCTTLRQVFCSGEVLSPPLANQFFDHIPDSELYNLYGPTEAAIDVSYYQCKKSDTHIPIGKPITNTQLYILDANKNILPIGAVGEIYIGGDCLAEGYINNQEMTDNVFVANPYASNNHYNLKLYKTGDFGRYDHLGKLHYLGRTDQQVKVRGSRVELGEIEHRLNSHPHIRECLIIAKPNIHNDIRIIAYYIAEPPKIDPQSLRDHLSVLLPSFMIPTSFVELDSWPLTHNGKLNRHALPDPERSDLHSRPYVAPRNSIEESIAELWAELLHIEKVGIHDNFFELGGHSLIATIAITRLQQGFDVKIPLSDIFKDPTIVTIARAIRLAQHSQLVIDSKTGDLGKDEEEITL